MGSGGFSKERLDRMHDVMATHVEQGRVPGLVALVSRRGEVHVEAVGTKAVGGSDPMPRNTIFRITSMTKPVTAVATMILVEECRLRLDDPVDRLLPELAGHRVLTRPDGPLDDNVPTNRPITVRDLLTFTWGFGMDFSLEFGKDLFPIQQAATDLQVYGLGPPTPPVPHTPDEWIRRLGTLPLMAQPGERWLYNTGSLVLGVLIARASGQPFETFLRERIFEPLGMKDTAFSVPAEKIGRLATCYAPDPASGALQLFDPAQDGQWSRPPAFPDGGAGLVSTVDDYLAFGQMLLNRGILGSERILSRPSVETMTIGQLTPEQKARSGEGWDRFDWGFGMSILVRRDGIAATPGRYGWDGGYGTSWSTDPAEGMVGILMTQCLGYPPLSPVYLDFWTTAYQAIDD